MISGGKWTGMASRRLSGICAAAALGAMAGAQPAGAQNPVIVATPASLGPVQSVWDESQGQFVPDMPTGADAAVKKAFGDRFAGLHFWRAQGREPVLALHLVGATKADIPSVEQLLAEGPLSTVDTPIRLVRARVSERELQNAAARLSRRIDGTRILGVGVDPLRNQLIVQAPRHGAVAATQAPTPRKPTVAERRLTRSSGLPPAAFRWETASAPKPALATELTGIFGGTRIYIGRGGALFSACTAGWGLRNASGAFMTTAAHCAPAGAPVHRSLDGFNGIGAEMSRVASSAYNRESGDIALYWAGLATARQWIGATNTMRYVQGASTPRVGEWVCFNGASTRSLSCGSIERVNVTQVPGGATGAAVGHQFCTTGQRGGSTGGDSGAAVWVPNVSGNERMISIRGTLSSRGIGLICATNAMTTLTQSAALPVTEAPPCS
jgi:hypothetical protein